MPKYATTVSCITVNSIGLRRKTLSRTERVKSFLEKMGFGLDKGRLKFRQMLEGRGEGGKGVDLTSG